MSQGSSCARPIRRNLHRGVQHQISRYIPRYSRLSAVKGFSEQEVCSFPHIIVLRTLSTTAAALAIGISVLTADSYARIYTDSIGHKLPLQPGLAEGRKVRALQAELNEPSTHEKVQSILRITTEAKGAEKAGDYVEALKKFSYIVDKYPDLAITNYARISRALLLYQTGSKDQAILELEDLEVALRGYAEVHAALASIIYSERPAERSYAEQQFDLATEFDNRYGDISWVASHKAWPPAMLNALTEFVELK